MLVWLLLLYLTELFLCIPLHARIQSDLLGYTQRDTHKLLLYFLLLLLLVLNAGLLKRGFYHKYLVSFDLQSIRIQAKEKCSPKQLVNAPFPSMMMMMMMHLSELMDCDCILSHAISSRKEGNLSVNSVVEHCFLYYKDDKACLSDLSTRLSRPPT